MENINFRQFLEITGPGKYSDLVPGWKGHPEGPFVDPKRKSNDPLHWRNYDYQKQVSDLQYDKARSEYEARPEDKKAREDFVKATSDALSSAMPTVPEGKPRGEYEGWSNWDTWAVNLWITNESDTYKKFRNKPASYIKRYILLPSYKKKIWNFHRDYEDRNKPVDISDNVDFDMVDWEQIAEKMNEDYF